MKHTRKWLSLFLCLALLCSFLPQVALPVSAADDDFVIEDGVLTDYNGPGGAVVIPDSVTSIGSLAFNDCTGLTSVTIPDSVTIIGNSAFYRCDGLTSVTIPDSVIGIGDGAFSFCSSLTAINVGSGNRIYSSINGMLFKKDQTKLIACPGGKYGTYQIPDSVTSIGNWTFAGCRSLESVTIPDSVTSIGDYAFKYCSSLTNVKIPDSVTSIGQEAFDHCTNLTNITISESGTSIGKMAFFNCWSLKSVTIPNKVSFIGLGAFAGCLSLESVTVLNPACTISDDTDTLNDPKRTTIYGLKDSTAQTYAENYGYTFVAIDGAEVPPDGPNVPGYDTSPVPYTFTYQNEGDFKATCWYSDSYFENNSYEYQPSLATMSLCLAMSAFGSHKGGYADKSQNVRDLMTKIGISPERIAVNEWFTVKPAEDSIGVAIGSKPITANGEDYTLVAVAIRGGGYEKEWSSNFTIGKSGLHSGFNTAKENVVSFLKQYLCDPKNEIRDKIKIWVVGYSRAAATANLVGGAIDDGALGSADYSLARKDAFIYTFETPAGATTNVRKQTAYSNIFNIINPNDPVPYVAPQAWGFCRYGIDKYLPTEKTADRYNDMKESMQRFFTALPSVDTYIVDDFQMKKLSLSNAGIDQHILLRQEKASFVIDDEKSNMTQGLFLDNYVRILAKEFVGARNSYCNYYESEIREICSVLLGYPGEKSKKLFNSLVSQAKEEWGKLLIAYLWKTGITIAGTEEDALQIVSDWLNKAIKDAGISDYNEKMVDSAGKKISDLTLALILNHPNYFTTAVCNGKGLGQAHYPELCYAWLTAMDPNYTKTPIASMSNGTYRIVRINCEVDVSVYNEYGDLVAAITDENPQEIPDSSIISGIDLDGQKYVVLPAEETYQVCVTARENDTVDYGIDEYCPETGDYSRTVNYLDVSVKSGEQLIGEAPALAAQELAGSLINGSTVKYTLQSPDSEKLAPDSDITGDGVKEAYYSIDISTSEPQYGIVTGAGARLADNYALVEAIPCEGFVFTGWYEADTCVSKEAYYRFRVSKDLNLIAKFAPESENPGEPETPSEKPEDKPSDDNSGKDEPVKTGDKPTEDKPARPDSGFRFDDVQNDKAFYFESVYWAYNAEPQITNGLDKTHFGPDAGCTRGQVVTFLWRAAGCPDPTSTSTSFTDVSEKAFYAKAVAWAVENKITNGMSPTSFGPDLTCTRGQIVTFLWRFRNSPQPKSKETVFTDVYEGAFYYNAVAWAVEERITLGMTATTFAPDATCTRGQIVTFLYRAVGEK